MSSMQKKVSGQIYESDGSTRNPKHKSRNSTQPDAEIIQKFEPDATIILGTLNQCDGTILEQTKEHS